MIQRIQTVYLVLGIAALLAARFIIGVTAMDVGLWTGVVDVGLIAAAILAVPVVFLYGRREVQRMCVLALQVLTLAAVAGTFYVQYLAGALPGIHAVGAMTWIDTLLPVAAYVFYWFARRAIDKDIALVRSMDRLR